MDKYAQKSRTRSLSPGKSRALSPLKHEQLNEKALTKESVQWLNGKSRSPSRISNTRKPSPYLFRSASPHKYNLIPLSVQMENLEYQGSKSLKTMDVCPPPQNDVKLKVPQIKTPTSDEEETADIISVKKEDGEPPGGSLETGCVSKLIGRSSRKEEVEVRKSPRPKLPLASVSPGGSSHYETEVTSDLGIKIKQKQKVPELPSASVKHDVDNGASKTVAERASSKRSSEAQCNSESVEEHVYKIPKITIRMRRDLIGEEPDGTSDSSDSSLLREPVYEILNGHHRSPRSKKKKSKRKNKLKHAFYNGEDAVSEKDLNGVNSQLTLKKLKFKFGGDSFQVDIPPQKKKRIA